MWEIGLAIYGQRKFNPVYSCAMKDVRMEGSGDGKESGVIKVREKGAQGEISNQAVVPVRKSKEQRCFRIGREGDRGWAQEQASKEVLRPTAKRFTKSLSAEEMRRSGTRESSFQATVRNTISSTVSTIRRNSTKTHKRAFKADYNQYSIRERCTASLQAHPSVRT